MVSRRRQMPLIAQSLWVTWFCRTEHCKPSGSAARESKAFDSEFQSNSAGSCTPFPFGDWQLSCAALWRLCVFGFAICVCNTTVLRAAEIDVPQVDATHAIHVNAETYASVQRGSYDVLAFEGRCELKQGKLVARADEITLWIERDRVLNAEFPGKIICYLNGNATVDWGDGKRLSDHRWTGRLFSIHAVSVDSGREVVRYDIPNLDWNREPQAFRLTQFSRPGEAQGQVLVAPPLLGPTGTSSVPAAANVQAGPNIPSMGGVPWNPNPGSNAAYTGPQSSALLPPGGLVIPNDGTNPYPAAGLQPESVAPPLASSPGAGIASGVAAPPFPSANPAARQSIQTVRQPPQRDPFEAKAVDFRPKKGGEISIGYDEERGESVFQILGGFRLVVEGVRVVQDDGSIEDFGTVSIEADNAVAWIRSDGPVNPMDISSSPDRPVELYLEGNIVFYQGNRVIYAERMYYNVSSEYGMILSAEVLTPVPQYQGLLRLKADVLQQRNSKSFMAYGAAVTSSQLGVPRYWLQSGEVEFTDDRDETQNSAFSQFDDRRPTNMEVASRSNSVFIGGVPVFWWPTFKTDLREPTSYLSSVKFRNDTIFGFQTFAEWNVYELLGIDGPEGSTLRLSTDYLSDRGPALGFRFDYDRPTTMLFGAPGYGTTDAWFIKDSGTDFLGVGRIGLQPEEEYRGRVHSQHRFFFSPNFEVLAESGWISDRDFLEQYFEQEWEQQKDFTTALRARRYNGVRMLDVFGQPRINDFFTETEWLPRIDQYWIGQDLLGGRLTWSAHNHVGYGHQRVGTTPIDPGQAAQTTMLPWESDSEGIRALTRQELSMPFSLGAAKVVPFVSGEAGFWNEDVNQDDVVRLTGQAGVRTSLPMWSVNPNVDSRLFDLRGLAHKMTFESEFFYADSSEDLSRFPLYDPLDDNAQEHFRKRFALSTFGGVIPPEFDERSFALRSGLQRWVTAGSKEVVDDMSQLRLGINNRWQTKRGVPGRERIVDLVSLDADFIYFPRAERDNFGEDTGAFRYDFRYHVGDRLTVLSDGYFDVFSQGLKTVSAGAMMSRPGRGDLYVGMLSIEGPVSANVLNGYLNYRLNEKWIVSSGAAFDFGSTGNIGQNLFLTRIGESALVQVGMQIDHLRDNVSFAFNIEPRFLPGGRLGGIGGQLIPPAGLYGVE